MGPPCFVVNGVITNPYTWPYYVMENLGFFFSAINRVVTLLITGFLGSTWYVLQDLLTALFQPRLVEEVAVGTTGPGLSFCARVETPDIRMVIPPLVRNPYNGYEKTYYWVDDHPLAQGLDGSLGGRICKNSQIRRRKKM